MQKYPRQEITCWVCGKTQEGFSFTSESTPLRLELCAMCDLYPGTTHLKLVDIASEFLKNVVLRNETQESLSHATNLLSLAIEYGHTYLPKQQPKTVKEPVNVNDVSAATTKQIHYINALITRKNPVTTLLKKMYPLPISSLTKEEAGYIIGAYNGGYTVEELQNHLNRINQK